MRLGWTTDPHLEFLSTRQARNFMRELAKLDIHALLLGGDISSGKFLRDDLQRFNRLPYPTYFVLGNHDYYDFSIRQGREIARDLSRQHRRLCWLEDVGYIELDDETALIGHGCWGDGRAGFYRRSDLFLGDFTLIHEYRGMGKLKRLQLMHKLGDEAGAYLKRWCSVAAKKFRRIFILTHVPLFPEATLYQGRQDPMGQPFFCCAGAGYDLIEVAEDFPNVQFTVLSGHTHDPAEVQISDNLDAIVMGAEYGEPKWRILEV